MKHSVKELKQIVNDNNVIGVEFYKPLGIQPKGRKDWSMDFNECVQADLNELPDNLEFDCDYELFDEDEYNENIIPNTCELYIDFREEYPPEMVNWVDNGSPVLVMCIRINDYYDFNTSRTQLSMVCN